MENLLNSQYRLRKIIGILGIFLPILILIVNQNMLASLSHSYYTPASIFFIGILFSFGIVLIAYKGYPAKKDDGERFSDDFLTTLAGVSILVTVIIPTKCTGSGHELAFCGDGYLFGHADSLKNGIHLLSAAVFLFILGLMCVKRFTKNDKLKFKYVGGEKKIDEKETLNFPKVGSMTLEKMEKMMVEKALIFHQQNISQAAKALGITRNALYRRMEKYGI